MESLFSYTINMNKELILDAMHPGRDGFEGSCGISARKGQGCCVLVKILIR